MQTPAVRNAIVHAVLAQKKLCFFEKSKIFLRLSENVTHKEDIGNSASRTCWTASFTCAGQEAPQAPGAQRPASGLNCTCKTLRIRLSFKRGSAARKSFAFSHFNLWSKARIFENVFYETVKGRAPIGGALAVDTSFVKNVFGKEKKQSFFVRQSRAVTGRNPTDRGRKATKVSLLTDHRGTPLCSVFHKANKSDILTLKHLLDTSSRKTNQLHAYNALSAALPREKARKSKAFSHGGAVLAFSWQTKVMIPQPAEPPVMHATFFRSYPGGERQIHAGEGT